MVHRHFLVACCLLLFAVNCVPVQQQKQQHTRRSLDQSFQPAESLVTSNSSSSDSSDLVRAKQLLGAHYPELCHNRTRRTPDLSALAPRMEFDTLNDVYRGACMAGFQLIGDACLTFSTNECAKSTYENVGIDNFVDLAADSVDISMLDAACDPKGKHKAKKISIAEIESLEELGYLMNIYRLTEFSQCTTNDGGYFVKVYNKSTCQYEPAVLQKAMSSDSSSFHIETFNQTLSGNKKYDFICKYTLQPETSKLKKREKEASGKRKNNSSPSPSSLANFNSSFGFLASFILAFHLLTRAISN